MSFLNLPIAQMMPGMEWIPIMLLLTIVGLLCGIVAVVLRIFFAGNVAGWSLGLASVTIGICSPIFFLLSIGRELSPFAYMIIATPLIPGVIALALRQKSRPRGFPIVLKEEGNEHQ